MHGRARLAASKSKLAQSYRSNAVDGWVSRCGRRRGACSDGREEESGAVEQRGVRFRRCPLVGLAQLGKLPSVRNVHGSGCSCLARRRIVLLLVFKKEERPTSQVENLPKLPMPHFA